MRRYSLSFVLCLVAGLALTVAWALSAFEPGGPHGLWTLIAGLALLAIAAAIWFRKRP